MKVWNNLRQQEIESKMKLEQLVGSAKRMAITA